jgi:hypothetical protein
MPDLGGHCTDTHGIPYIIYGIYTVQEGQNRISVQPYTYGHASSELHSIMQVRHLEQGTMRTL